MVEQEKPIEFNITSRVPENPLGWFEIVLPEFVMSRLQSYIETAKKNPTNYNDHLAGNISNSLLLEDKDNWFFQTVLSPLLRQYTQHHPKYERNISILSENATLCLDPFWVNFQKENEVNPLHDHDGIFSFVIWVKIPTDWREQHALPICANSNTPAASNFAFCYVTMLGLLEHYEYHLDKEKEGCMLLFPARLMHRVNPFYNCDKERISISGNVRFDISENAMRKERSQREYIERLQRGGKDGQK